MSDLSSLPAELIDMVSTSLDNADILNLRSQSRAMRNGTTFEFCRRFLNTPIEVIGSRRSFRSMTKILRNPDFSSAKLFPQELVIFDPAQNDMTNGDKSVLPTAKDIDRLFAALPRLQALTIRGDEAPPRWMDERAKALQWDQENLAPAVLKGLVRMASPELQLTKLDLYSCAIDSELLIEALCAFEHSLSDVSLRQVVLFGGPKHIGWHEVYLILFRLDLVELCLEHLSEGLNSYLTLHEHGVYDDFYLSYETGQQPRSNTLQEGDVYRTGSAQFSRFYALLTEGYVELGLRKLRKSQDLKLYKFEK